MADDEVWRPVPGYETRYEVSTLGRVRSLRRQRILSQRPEPSRGGYLRVELYDGRRAKYRKVHSLVLRTFVGPRPDGYDGAHDNGVLTDNTLSNLKWATRGENEADKRRHGTVAILGSRHARATITEADVVELRRRHAGGERTGLLAKAYHFTSNHVRMIVNGQRWGHVR